MEQELGPERTRAVMKYQGVAKLSKDAVREIVVTIWPDAPDVERKKAILLCTQYNLNPLMKHIYILGPFTDKKTGEVSWSLALSVQTNRLMASRQGRFSYVDNTPRIMTDDEQKTIFGEVDHTKLWAITKIRDNQGNEAQGYGNWPRDRIAYGEDKGNTKANMAFVRSERQALARLRPDALPENVEVVDEKYVPASGQIIDASTGEIVTSEAKQVIKSEATVRSPDGIDETGEHFAEPPKGETSDLKSLTFANQGEFYAACLKHFNVNKTQVDKEVPEYNLADKGQRQKAWLQIVAVYGSKE